MKIRIDLYRRILDKQKQNKAAESDRNGFHFDLGAVHL